ncbi:uncharacterized protein LOC111407826 [Olea europaea var. sylvestris]|uniref:uncharacterized protein LOC111407826 n=1 Tax=Olea europaea var. sylvestris TaxID=158386 RepID=UPI000C1D57E1|nr:uncharacterized protein LOC111407826 [Olea europaea var. sylvestris]
MKVHMLAMKYNFEFRVKKSNKEVYTIICIDEKCKWHLRATKFKNCDYFQVHKYVQEHTCSMSIRQNDHRQARLWVVGRHVMPKFQNPNTIYRPADIVNDMRREFALGPCIPGFHSSMRKVVVVDGTFFMGKYKVDSKNDASWTWFFMKLKEVTGDTEDLVVISDRHPSIINGVQAIYQNAHHGHCIYHIKAKAYTLEEFENYMNEIKRIDIKAWEYLVKAPFHLWARSHFQGNRYNIMT